MVSDGRDGRVADQTVNGGDVDDAAVSLLASLDALHHVAGDLLGHREDGGQVEVHREVPVTAIELDELGAGALLAASAVH